MWCWQLAVTARECKLSLQDRNIYKNVIDTSNKVMFFIVNWLFFSSLFSWLPRLVEGLIARCLSSLESWRCVAFMEIFRVAVYWHYQGLLTLGKLKRISKRLLQEDWMAAILKTNDYKTNDSGVTRFITILEIFGSLWRQISAQNMRPFQKYIVSSAARFGGIPQIWCI